jgi:hypothetical protein
MTKNPKRDPVTVRDHRQNLRNLFMKILDSVSAEPHRNPAAAEAAAQIRPAIKTAFILTETVMGVRKPARR